MNKNTYFISTAILFLIVGTAHFARVIFSWPIIIAGWKLPLEASWIAFILVFLLVYHALRLKNISSNRIITQSKEQKAKNISKLEEYIKKKDEITNDEIEGLLGVSHATATRYLDELEKRDLVEQVGESGSGVYYKIK